MLKIFQILNGICYYDATPVHPTLADTVGKYSPDIVFIEAPVYVFEGWGYDETQTGDAKFIQPIPPDGWRYNIETGQFYELNPNPVNTNNSYYTKEKLAVFVTEGVLTADQYKSITGIDYIQ